MNSSLVLIVDDSSDYADILATKLGLAGFKTATAKDGVEGLEMAKELMPDIIMLDVQMPNMDGITTLSYIKKEPNLATTKVFLLSALSDPREGEYEKEEAEAKKEGAVDFFSKSMELDEIVSRVKTLANI